MNKTRTLLGICCALLTVNLIILLLVLGALSQRPSGTSATRLAAIAQGEPQGSLWEEEDSYYTGLALAEASAPTTETMQRTENVLKSALGETTYAMWLDVPTTTGQLDYYVMNYAKTAGANICFSRSLLRGRSNPAWRGKFSGPALAAILARRGCVAALEGDNILYFEKRDHNSKNAGAEAVLSEAKAGREVNVELPGHFVPVADVIELMAQRAHLTITLPEISTAESVLLCAKKVRFADVLNVLGRATNSQYNSTNLVESNATSTSATSTAIRISATL